MIATTIPKHDELCEIALWAVKAADITPEAVEIKLGIPAEQARHHIERLAALEILTPSKARGGYRPFTNGPRGMQKLLVEKGLVLNAETAAGGTDANRTEVDTKPAVQHDNKAGDTAPATNNSHVTTAAPEASKPDKPHTEKPTKSLKRRPTKSKNISKVTRLGMTVNPEEAVVEINRLARSGMEAIGDYLIATFFAGDIANVRDEGRSSPGFTQLRRLKDQLEIRYSSLCQILCVQKQRSELEQAGHGDLLTKLTFSHHARLLSVQDEEKVALLKQAMAAEWTVKQLGAEVAKLKPERTPRPLTPGRAMARVQKVGQALDYAADERMITAVSALPVAERRELRDRVEQQIAVLQRLHAALQGDD